MIVEEPEDIEEIVELTPLDDFEDLVFWEQSEEGPQVDILKEPCIQNSVRNYSSSIIPLVITDTRLQIVYGNDSFNNDIIKNQPFLNKSFLKVIAPFPRQIELNQILQSIKSKSTGFSWNGRVNFSHTNFLNIQANLLITPIFPPGGKQKRLPLGYLLILDDVTEENRDILRSTFANLLHASELKDKDTGNHIKRVGEYSRALSKHLFQKQIYPEIDMQFIDNITFLAPMHDVGKIGISDDILNKSGPLTEWEWKQMKEHTLHGAFIMSGYPSKMASQIPLYHHVRWDGTGYPFPVSEEMIPLPARIVAITDVYDALRMRRNYKEPYSHERACEILARDSGAHFDPILISNFFEIENRFRDIFNLLRDKRSNML